VIDPASTVHRAAPRAVIVATADGAAPEGLYSRPCAECGVSFAPKWETQDHCGPECYHAARANRCGARHVAPRACEWRECHRIYTPHRPDQQYCSAACDVAGRTARVLALAVRARDCRAGGRPLPADTFTELARTPLTLADLDALSAQYRAAHAPLVGGRMLWLVRRAAAVEATPDDPATVVEVVEGVVAEREKPEAFAAAVAQHGRGVTVESILSAREGAREEAARARRTIPVWLLPQDDDAERCAEPTQTNRRSDAA
jgi:hypothetical protein